MKRPSRTVRAEHENEKRQNQTHGQTSNKHKTQKQENDAWKNKREKEDMRENLLGSAEVILGVGSK